MAETSIEWSDYTWNPTRGCTKVSPGCKHCYAETFAERWRGIKGHPYEQGFDLRLVPEKLAEPLHWKKPRRVFVNSMSDLFHEDVPFEYIARVYAVMLLAHWHTFQVLTKRAKRMREWHEWAAGGRHVYTAAQSIAMPRGMDKTGPTTWPPRNVWLGCSVESQQYADERIPELLLTPAVVRFISAEPLLGPLDLDCWPESGHRWFDESQGLDWVIVGGESGNGARPFDLAWARSIVKQCKAAGVACFVKQLGANAVVRNDEDDEIWPGCVVPTDDDYEPAHQGELGPLVFRSRKGGDPSEWPEDLRVRQFPERTVEQ